MSGAIETALEQITTAIGDLRSLITDLRPAALDELGTKPALETLVARVAPQTDLDDRPRGRPRLRGRRRRRRATPPRSSRPSTGSCRKR